MSLLAARSGHGQTLQGLLNNIDKQNSYRQELIDYINNTAKLEQTDMYLVQSLNISALEEMVKDIKNGDGPYRVLADAENERLKPSLDTLSDVINSR